MGLFSLVFGGGSPSPNDPRIEEAFASVVEKARGCSTSAKHFEERVGDIDGRMIVAAAVKIERLIISLPAPARHPDIMRALWNINRKLADVPPCNQGFLTQAGVFVTREEAAVMLERDKPVFSEDLW